VGFLFWDDAKKQIPHLSKKRGVRDDNFAEIATVMRRVGIRFKSEEEIENG
jgi:hypothetical protein